MLIHQLRSSRPVFAMLQRKQSLFLLIAVVCGVLTFVFPVDTFTRNGQAYIFRTYGLFTAEGVEVVDATLKVPFALVIGLLTVLLGVVIFLYRNRPRQLRLVQTLAALLMAVQVFLYITDNSIRAYLQAGGKVERSFGLSFILPLVMVVLAVLAARNIRKDEQLVRSMDRLR